MADISITAASVIASANAKTAQGVAGEAITAGQTLYLSSVDNRIYKADANASPATADCIGIALNGAPAAGLPVTYVYEDPAFTPGGTLSLSVIADSGVYVLSGTAGGIAPMDDLAAGMYPVVLGVAYSTTQMSLRIAKQTSAVLTA